MRVYWNWNGSPEQELEFVNRTANFMTVRYPQGSVNAGRPWRIGQKTVTRWIESHNLRIEA